MGLLANKKFQAYKMNGTLKFSHGALTNQDSLASEETSQSSFLSLGFAHLTLL